MYLILALALLGDVDWGPIKTSENLHLIYDADTFDPPVLLPSPVNTVGWEDSCEISPDGNTLTFMYMRLDLYLYLADAVARFHTPPRDGYSAVDDNRKYASDLFYATNDGMDNWTVHSYGPPVNTTYGLEGSLHMTADQKQLFFSRSWTDGNGRSHRGIFASRYNTQRGIWAFPRLVGRPVNQGSLPPNTADNPFLHTGSNRLFFENDDTGNIDLYSTPWPIPRLAVPPTADEATWLNDGTDDDTQIWVRPTDADPEQAFTLFCRNFVVIEIYSPQDGVNTPLGLIASGALTAQPNAAGLGEPSLDMANGRIYMLYVFKAVDPTSGKTWYDTDVIYLPFK